MYENKNQDFKSWFMNAILANDKDFTTFVTALVEFLYIVKEQDGTASAIYNLVKKQTCML